MRYLLPPMSENVVIAFASQVPGVREARLIRRNGEHVAISDEGGSDQDWDVGSGSSLEHLYIGMVERHVMVNSFDSHADGFDLYDLALTYEEQSGEELTLDVRDYPMLRLLRNDGQLIAESEAPEQLAEALLARCKERDYVEEAARLRV